MLRLVIRIKKKPDGSSALSCQRPDGSIAWQRQQGGNAAFFPHHDLTHYAVETVLQYRQGFFDLIARGWTFTDFGTPNPRGPIPIEAHLAEQIVGLLDAERLSDDESTTNQFNTVINQSFQTRGIEARLHLTDDQLDTIRRSMRDLFARWDAVPPGRALELEFEIGPPNPQSTGRPV